MNDSKTYAFTNRSNRKNLLCLILVAGALLIFIGLVISVSFGAKNIPLLSALGFLFNPDSSLESQIVTQIRLPRAICAIIIGCFLASSGSIMQGITQNYIASPSIMGVTQGSALSVSIYMALQSTTGSIGKIAFAFIGAAVSSLFIFLLSMKKNHINVTRMILAGASLGMLFISLASMIALLTNNTKNLGFWIAGGLSSANWTSVTLLSIFAVIIIPFVIFLSPKIMILSLGDETAIGFGVSPNKVRIISLISIVVLTGSSAAVGGNIAFVCLIVPHISRMCIGADYKLVIPVSMVFGGVLLVFSDVLARLLASPYEVPLGAITSLLGVPVLIYLIRKGGRA